MSATLWFDWSLKQFLYPRLLEPSRVKGEKRGAGAWLEILLSDGASGTIISWTVHRAVFELSFPDQ